MRSGIEASYAGTTFRSRLEARWAIFFDALGWPWEYEPFDANGYIPDFVLTGPLPVLVEVKPATSWNDYTEHTHRLEISLKGQWTHDILIVGLSPKISVDTWPDQAWQPNALCIGLLGERPTEENEGWWWEPGHWDKRAASFGFFHPYGWYATRPLGLGDNSHPEPIVHSSELDRLWTTTRNPTRWRHR